MILERSIKCALLSIKLSEPCNRAYHSLGIGKLLILQYRQCTSFDLGGDTKSPKPVALSVEWGFFPDSRIYCTFLERLDDSSSYCTEKGVQSPSSGRSCPSNAQQIQTGKTLPVLMESETCRQTPRHKTRLIPVALLETVWLFCHIS